MEHSTENQSESQKEVPIPISCKSCIHVKTCAAYRAFAGALKQLNENYEFIKDTPFPPETLAKVCTEYTPPSKIFNIKPVST